MWCINTSKTSGDPGPTAHGTVTGQPAAWCKYKTRLTFMHLKSSASWSCVTFSWALRLFFPQLTSGASLYFQVVSSFQSSHLSSGNFSKLPRFSARFYFFLRAGTETLVFNWMEWRMNASLDEVSRAAAAQILLSCVDLWYRGKT